LNVGSNPGLDTRPEIKMEHKIKQAFIDWFLSIPDVDETLVDDHSTGPTDGFHDETVQTLYMGFKSGFSAGIFFGI
jgi:hypothetical protein